MTRVTVGGTRHVRTHAAVDAVLDAVLELDADLIQEDTRLLRVFSRITLVLHKRRAL